MAHFRYVHGYESMNRVGSVSVDGPYLESRFTFKSTRRIVKFAKFTLDLSATTHVFGLGYSFVEIREHSIGMDMRLWVLSTPVAGLAGARVAQTQTVESRAWVSPGKAARTPHEQVHRNDAIPGRSAGRYYLET